MMKFIDLLSLPVIVVIAVLLGTAPFGAQPHLLEKLEMLAAGNLTRPIDIFDLFLHGTPLVILAIKLWRMATKAAGDNSGD